MMKRVLIMAGVLLILGGSLVFAGGGQQSNQASGGGVVLNYPHYSVGTHLSRPAFDSFFARFTAKYKGQISVKIEELPSDTVYTDKMKVLAAAKELPDVIDGKDGVRDLAIANGQAVELSAFLARDPDFRDKVIGPAALAANTINGKIYSIADGLQMAGYYYNKEMFTKAGISPAKTWDEFFSNCDKLLAAGHTPLALMTGENSWTTNLILGAMVASKGQAGLSFMTTKYPRTYQTPELIQSLGEIQRCLQRYTTPDALGALYANAANNFLMEQAAIISNGSWMIADFSNREKTASGFENKVGFAMFPGDGIMCGYGEGYSVCAAPEKQEAAWTFLKEIASRESQMERLTMMGSLPTALDLELSPELRRSSPLLAQSADAAATAKYRYYTFDTMAYAGVVDAFGRYYPELAAGTLTPAAMAARLDDAAAAAR
jgi:raffinose/stachyose/melibiose transport system substrate-binding protein